MDCVRDRDSVRLILRFYPNGVASHSLGLPPGAQRTAATPGSVAPLRFYPNGVASHSLGLPSEAQRTAATPGSVAVGSAAHRGYPRIRCRRKRSAPRLPQDPLPHCVSAPTEWSQGRPKSADGGYTVNPGLCDATALRKKTPCGISRQGSHSDRSSGRQPVPSRLWIASVTATPSA